MSLTLNLLGRPRIRNGSGTDHTVRSRKSWAVLAYLLLGDRAPTRAELAALLFDEADDPLRALRWSLSELRRALAGHAVLEGDPVVLELARDVVVDVAVVSRGSWADAMELPDVGAELLAGVEVAGAAGFESWLLAERRRVAAASEAILHEAALGAMSQGRLDRALGYATRVAAMSPLDENHHALLIRLYRMTGDEAAAQRQLAICTAMLARELGTTPGPAVAAALRERRVGDREAATHASIEALAEAGAAAVAAGATETGADSLRAAVRMSDQGDHGRLRLSTRLALAGTLVHSLRGLDEEGMAALLAADDIAAGLDDAAAMAEARAELGYVDFLRARYDRAEVWLSQARDLGAGDPAVAAKATTYLGSVESDRADYVSALLHLAEGKRLAGLSGDGRRAAYAAAMLGRVHLLRGDLAEAEAELDTAVGLSVREHWLAFLPWPQALRGQLELARGDASRSAEVLDQAFARACQLRDPCWEGISGRGLALAAEARGETDLAFELLADARVRSNRWSDPYVWLDGYILDAQCTLGLRHGHPETADWVDALRLLASRTGMRELNVRSMLHGAVLGREGEAEAAARLARSIANPVLRRLARD